MEKKMENEMETGVGKRAMVPVVFLMPFLRQGSGILSFIPY